MLKYSVLACLLQSSFLMMSFAADFAISSVFVKPGIQKDTYKIAIESVIQMSPEQVTVLENGIPMTFTYTFVVEEKLGIVWWQEDDNALSHYNYTISYNALTQQYVVNTHQKQRYENFPTLSLALSYIAEPKNVVLQIHNRSDDREYRAGVRLKLDINELPTPLRIPAYLSKEWNLDTGWKYWGLTPW